MLILLLLSFPYIFATRQMADSLKTAKYKVRIDVLDRWYLDNNNNKYDARFRFLPVPNFLI